VFAGVFLALAALSGGLEGPAQPFTVVRLHAGLFLGVLLRTGTRDWPTFAAVALAVCAGFDIWLGRPAVLALALSASIVVEGVLGASPPSRTRTSSPPTVVPFQSRSAAASSISRPGGEP